MPPTFLQTLAERHEIAEKHALLALEQEKRAYDRAVADVRTGQLLEDWWDSADPFQGGRALPAGLGSAPNDLYHPGAIGRHSARPGSRRDGALPPYYYTEFQHWQIIDAARTIQAFCPTAVTVLDILAQFAMFTGFTYTITDRNKPGAPEPSEDGEPAEPREERAIVKAAQDALDKWQKEVNWYRWEVELFRRSIRDGEAFLLLDQDTPTTSGMVGLRSIEPEQVKEPQTTKAINGRLGITGRDATWKFGILTHKEDTATPLSYWVVSQYNDSKNIGTLYDAEEIAHIKTEWVERQAKRGVSDFYVNLNDFPGAKKLLRNLREGATVQAAIAWIREHPPGMSVQPLGAGSNMTTRTGQRATGVQYDGPTMLDVSAGMKYTAGPLAGTGQSETLIQVLQAALRNIGARWQMPEGLVSGDASNANLASALVAEGPFTRALQSRQWYYVTEYKRIIERVLEKAAMAGIIPGGENLLEEVEVSVDMPPVVARKQKEETERNALLNERGILSNQTWSSREDLDFDDEQSNIAVDPIEPPSIMLGLDEPMIEEGEAEDDTANQNASRQDEPSKGSGSKRPRGKSLGAKGSNTTTGTTGTNRERVS